MFIKEKFKINMLFLILKEITTNFKFIKKKKEIKCKKLSLY